MTKVNRTVTALAAGIGSLFMCLHASHAQDYTVEILFADGESETFVEPGDVVRADLWVDVPRALGMSAYVLSVRVEATEPPALISRAAGILPEGFGSFGANPIWIYQPGVVTEPHENEFSPDGLVAHFGGIGHIGPGSGGLRRGRVRVGEVDIQVPCVESIEVAPVFVPGVDGFATYDQTVIESAIFHSGFIRTSAENCGGDVLMGLSDNAIEMGIPVSLFWQLDRVHSCKATGGWQADLDSSGEVAVRITETTAYGIECLSDHDDAVVEAAAVVEVFKAPAVHAWVDPPRVAPGETTTVHWTSEYSEVCFAILGGETPNDIGSEGNLDFVPAPDYPDAEVGCGGQGGLLGAFSVAPVAIGDDPVSVTLDVSPIFVREGDPLTVSWVGENTNDCVIRALEESGAPAGQHVIPVEASGILDLFLTAHESTRYTIKVKCSGTTGSAEARSAVTVRPIPAVDLEADTLELVAGESAVLEWSSTDTSHCIAQGNWEGDLLMSGDLEISPTETSVYQIGCVPLQVPVAEGARFADEPEPVLVWDEVTIVVIPEPTRWLLQLFALASVFALRRARTSACD